MSIESDTIHSNGNNNSDDTSKDDALLHADFLEVLNQLKRFLKETNLEDFSKFVKVSRNIDLIDKFFDEALKAIVDIYKELEHKFENTLIINLCNYVIRKLVSICKPSVCLIYILEQMELSNSNKLFYDLLIPLRLALLRCRNAPVKLDMCIDIIKKFVSSLPIPRDEESQEDNDEIVQNIVECYINIINFVDNLFDNLEIFFEVDLNIRNRTKYLMLDLIISMFGKPICYINKNYSNNMLILEKLIFNVSRIESDIVHLFRFINHGNWYNKKLEYKNKKFKTYQNNENEIYFNANDLALSNYYWIVLNKESNTTIFSIYDPYYIAYNCINMSNYLLTNIQREIIMIKGLDLANYALNIVKKYGIPFEHLELSIHQELIDNHINCIMNTVKGKIQKYALDNFIEYITCFDSEAKYCVIEKVIKKNYHPKIIAVIIGLLKNVVAESLNNRKSQKSNLNQCAFLERNLQDLLLEMCVLKNGVETKLIEISDQIIALLNFILFLVAWDKNNEKANQCRIMDLFKDTDYCYFKLLTDALNTQKSEWTVQLENLKHNSTEKQTEDSKMKTYFDELSYMSTEQKIELCEQSINTLLLIENISSRIHEYLDINV